MIGVAVNFITLSLYIYRDINAQFTYYTYLSEMRNPQHT